MNRADPPIPAEAQAQALFLRAPFARWLGMVFDGAGHGTCDAHLPLTPDLLQQDGVAHAGVQAALADHTGGAAAATLIGPGERILSVEFKIHMLRPARGDRLVCHARVLKPGRRFHIAEADVYAHAGEDVRHTARMLQTLAVVAPE
jgi:uncharacterized protein (TIGR00369 family)